MNNGFMSLQEVAEKMNMNILSVETFSKAGVLITNTIDNEEKVSQSNFLDFKNLYEDNPYDEIHKS